MGTSLIMTSALLVPPRASGPYRLNHCHFTSVEDTRSFSQDQACQYHPLSTGARKSDLHSWRRQRSGSPVCHTFPSARHFAAVSRVTIGIEKCRQFPVCEDTYWKTPGTFRFTHLFPAVNRYHALFVLLHHLHVRAQAILPPEIRVARGQKPPQR